MRRTYPIQDWEVSSVFPNLTDIECTNPKGAVVEVMIEDAYTHNVKVAVDGGSVLNVSDMDICRAYADSSTRWRARSALGKSPRNAVERMALKGQKGSYRSLDLKVSESSAKYPILDASGVATENS